MEETSGLQPMLVHNSTKARQQSLRQGGHINSSQDIVA